MENKKYPNVVNLSPPINLSDFFNTDNSADGSEEQKDLKKDKKTKFKHVDKKINNSTIDMLRNFY